MNGRCSELFQSCIEPVANKGYDTGRRSRRTEEEAKAENGRRRRKMGGGGGGGGGEEEDSVRRGEGEETAQCLHV